MLTLNKQWKLFYNFISFATIEHLTYISINVIALEALIIANAWAQQDNLYNYGVECLYGMENMRHFHCFENKSFNCFSLLFGKAVEKYSVSAHIKISFSMCCSKITFVACQIFVCSCKIHIH